MVSSQVMDCADERDISLAKDVPYSLALGEVRIKVFIPEITVIPYFREEPRCVEVYPDNGRTTLKDHLRVALSGVGREVFKGTMVVSSQVTRSRINFDPGSTESVSAFLELKSCHLGSSV